MLYEEKKKGEEIDVKQSIFMLREAWREVTKQTIQNCWRKIQITNDEEINDVINVELEYQRDVEELGVKNY